MFMAFFGEKTTVTIGGTEIETLIDCSGPEPSVSEVDNTVLSSTSRKYRPNTIVDNGTVTCSFYHTGDEDFLELGGEDAVTEIVIKYENFTESISHSFDGFLLNKKFSGMEDGSDVICEIEIRIDGDITEDSGTVTPPAE